ncbi:MAG: carbon storage regulator [Bythopirellula sp.]
MLVLSRKVGERIHIGNDIFIEVRRLAGSRVTLAVNAPKNVRILRGELMEAAKAFDVLEEPTVSSSESTTDTVVMSGEDASAVLPPTNVTDKPNVPGQSHTVS